MLRYVHQTFHEQKALVYRKEGKWVPLSHQEVYDTVRKISAGLLHLGLKAGERVGLVADPSPFWMMMDLAVLSAGAISVPMFSNISSENLQYEMKDSGMRFLFVGSEAQFLIMKPFFSEVEHIITLTKASGAEKCISWDDLLFNGADRLLKFPGEWDQKVDSIQGKDTATLIYTSGSTGIPKGVEITQSNLISQVAGARTRFPNDFKQDVALSCLPLAHVFERMVSYYYFSSGITLYFADDIKKVGEYLRDVHPTIITMVPRLLEKVYAKFQAGADLATGLKKVLVVAAMERAKTKNPTSSMTLKDRLFDLLVYKKLREALGGRIRLLISGSAPLDTSIYTFFLNVGIPIYEGYGLTETSPVLAVNYPGRRKVGTVGTVYPGVEISIGDDGEILAKGSGVMKGYYNKPEDTALVIDNSGWLHTGDLGHLDNEGFLKITGRKKELFKTANGKYVAPVPIEQSLIKNKLLDMAMVIAEGRPFTTAILFPDLENLKVLKTELAGEAMENELFLSSPQVEAYVKKILEEINAKLNHWEQVQKFHLAKTPLSIDAGELTPTMKIRRHVVEEKFRKEIDLFYAKKVK